MKVNNLFQSLAASLLLCGVTHAAVINEFEPNPVGTDPATVNFEILGDPGGTYSDLYVVGIESDLTSIGTLDRVSGPYSGSFDSNGLAVLSIPDFENPSFTAVLLQSAVAPVAGTDLDTDDDGILDDVSPLGTVMDAINIPDIAGDAAITYGSQLGGADFGYTGDEPKLVFRDGLTGAWYAINDEGNVPESIFDITGTQVSPNAVWRVNGAVVDPELTTFGSVNPSIPEPSTIVMSLLAASAVGAVGMRRRLG